MSLAEATPEEYLRARIGDAQYEAPVHQPPSDDFIESLSRPDFVTIGRETFAAYTFKGDEDRVDLDGPPLVSLISFNNSTAKYSTARMLNALSTNTGRSIISLDHTGADQSYHPSLWHCVRSSVDSVSGSYTEVLDRIGVGKVDLMGICIGGVIASHMAAKLGDQARSLVTFNCIGFEEDTIVRLSQRVNNKGALAQASRHFDAIAVEDAERLDNAAVGLISPGEHPNIHDSKLRKNIMLGVLGWELSRTTPMRDMRFLLDGKTKWHDFAGEADVITNDNIHRAVLAERERRHPGSSEFTALKDIGHNWPLIRMPYTAKLVDLELKMLDSKDQSTEINPNTSSDQI